MRRRIGLRAGAGKSGASLNLDLSDCLTVDTFLKTIVNRRERKPRQWRNGRKIMKIVRWIVPAALAIGTALAVGALAVSLPSLASANDELMVMQNNPAYWPMPTRDYSATRFSQLAQINKDNVKDLQVAWTFSTASLKPSGRTAISISPSLNSSSSSETWNG